MMGPLATTVILLLAVVAVVLAMVYVLVPVMKGLGAGVTGSLLGASINYVLALWLGRPIVERIGHWFFIKAEQLDAAERYFEKHGEITTLVARLIPGIRQLISVPAGLARMNVAKFALYTGLGAGFWCMVLVGVGYAAGASEDLWRPMLRDATLWILAGLVALVGVYIWLHRRGSEIA